MFRFRMIPRQIKRAAYRLKYFFGTLPTKELGTLWVTTRHNNSITGLWTALGVSIVSLLYAVSIPLHSGQTHIPEIALPPAAAHLLDRLHPGFVKSIAHILQVFLLGLWIHKYRKIQRQPLLQNTLFAAALLLLNNTGIAAGLFASPQSTLWLWIYPVVTIPILGNRRALPLLLLNLAAYIVINTGELFLIVNIIGSCALAIFFMMIQLEYYRREFRLHKSLVRLKERAMEIELIKEYMGTGILLLDRQLKIRPNYNDSSIKLLHKKNLNRKYFPKLMREVLQENEYYLNGDPQSQIMDLKELDSEIRDYQQWQTKIEHYFQMLMSGQMDTEELEQLNPMKCVKVYSYEGCSYLNFHVTMVKSQNKDLYFMVLIHDETNKVAGEYQLWAHERKQLQRAEILFALLHHSPQKQQELYRVFTETYTLLSRTTFSEKRSFQSPRKLTVSLLPQLETLHRFFSEFHLQDMENKCRELIENGERFLQLQVEEHQKIFQTNYLQFIMQLEQFLFSLKDLENLICFLLSHPLKDYQPASPFTGETELSVFSRLQTEARPGKKNLTEDLIVFSNLYLTFRMLVEKYNQDPEKGSPNEPGA